MLTISTVVETVVSTRKFGFGWIGDSVLFTLRMEALATWSNPVQSRPRGLQNLLCVSSILTRASNPNNKLA
jgi:hypothetical protein